METPETPQTCLRTVRPICGFVVYHACTWQDLFSGRMKVGPPPQLSDRELFQSLPLGDPWHDAQMLEVWDYLWRHPKTDVPLSWQTCLNDFDRELRATLGS